jgi:FkbM family methyltransferase
MQVLTTIVGALPRSWVRAVSRSQWRHPLLKRGFEWAADRFRNRDGTIQSGVGRGLRFNPGGSNAGYVLGTSEPGLQRLLATLLRPGMVLFDVGANVGFISILAARLVGEEGRVISFEPLPVNADWLEHNVRLNRFDRVTVRREAVGLADGESRFQISAVSSTLGMLETSRFAKQDDVIAGIIPVKVRSLDSLGAEGSLPRPEVIKVDTEGAEVDVLRGAAEMIRAARPILLIELHGTNADVARALDEYSYHAVVMGTPQPVAEAYWNAFVVAVPAERRDLINAVEPFCAPACEAR